MSLDVTAALCNDQQLIFKMLYFLFSVIVARVKKVLEPDAMSRVYKVKIKKDFRVSLNQHSTFFTWPNYDPENIDFFQHSDSRTIIECCTTFRE
jgi:hypothetical protein